MCNWTEPKLIKSKHIRADASVVTGYLPNTNASNIQNKTCPKKLHQVLILHAWFDNFNNIHRFIHSNFTGYIV